MRSSADQNWLSNNKHIRMDANVENNAEIRRNFHKIRYEFAAQHVKDMVVLDGACGTGYGSAILGRTAKVVFGIDLDPDAVQYAKKKYGSDSIQFSKSPVELTPFEDSYFDAIVSYETVEHTLSPECHFKEMVRVLKPDGVAFISIPNSWGFTDQHFFDFNLELLQSFTDTYFSSVVFFANNPPSNPETNNGIEELTTGNNNCECILAVCRNPKKSQVIHTKDRIDYLLSDIYKNAFIRHNDYLRLSNRFFYSGLSKHIKSLSLKLKRRLRRS